MKRSTLVLLWCAGVAVALGAAAWFIGLPLYAGFVNSTSSAPPSLDPVTPSEVSSGSPVDINNLSGEWVAGTGSFAGYRVNEVLRGNDATVTGRTTKVDGLFTIDEFTLSAATVTVDVASISTPEPSRDDYFRTSAMETDRFPSATFVLTQPVTAQRPEPNSPQEFTATGDLSLHGVTKSVEAQITAALTNDGVQVAGNIPIVFADFGVQAPNLGFVTVEKSGSVEFRLDLVKK